MITNWAVQWIRHEPHDVMHCIYKAAHLVLKKVARPVFIVFFKRMKFSLHPGTSSNKYTMLQSLSHFKIKINSWTSHINYFMSRLYDGHNTWNKKKTLAILYKKESMCKRWYRVRCGGQTKEVITARPPAAGNWTPIILKRFGIFFYSVNLDFWR